MNERSLISLTAITLVTGVLLFVAGHMLLNSMHIASPRSLALVTADDDGDTRIADPNVQQTLFDEPAEVAAAEAERAAGDVAREPGIEPGTVDTDLSEPTLRAPELAAPVLTAPVLPDDSITGTGEEYLDADGSEILFEAPPGIDDVASIADDRLVGPDLNRSREYDASESVPYEMTADAEPIEPPNESSGSMAPVAMPIGEAQAIAGLSSATGRLPMVAPVVPLRGFPPPMPRAPDSPLLLQAGSANNPAVSQVAPSHAPSRLGPSVAYVAQVPPMDPESGADQPTLPPPPVDRSSSSNANAGGNTDSASLENEETKLGEAPEETKTELQFLRRQTILLDPGQYQFDVTFEYLINESDFPLAQLNGGALQIGEAQLKQRLLLLPIEFRLGLTPVTQFFVNVPFGWSNGEFSALAEDEFSNSGGVGDISTGITRMLIEGTDDFPDVLGTLAFSIPTGDSNFVTSLSTPGNTLGQGFWTLTAGLSFIQTYDPIVVFYGFGYRHRFESSFDVNIGDGRITVNPGKQIFYRFGLGFAVNPRVTLSASFIGSYITEDYIDGVRLAGSIREPMSVRLAATITRQKELKKDERIKTLEPFINFGVTDAAANALFGVSLTH